MDCVNNQNDNHIFEGTSLSDHRLTNGSIATVYYIPNFISRDEEETLLRNVARVPKPRWTQLSNRRLQNWGGVPSPKGMLAEEIPQWLKIYTAKVGQLNIFNNNTPNHVLVNEYLPGQGIMPHLDGSLFYPTISTINLGCHTMLNFYHPIDSQASQAEIASNTSSLMSNNFESENEIQHHHSSATASDPKSNDSIKSWPERLAFRLLLEPRSLVILKDQAYQHYLHGIEENKLDVITTNVLNLDAVTDYDKTIGAEIERAKARVSLTIRFVPKTTKKPIFRLGN